MVVTVNIELGNDGTYGAYIAGDNPLGFGVIGEGNTVNEAKEDFLNVFNAYKADAYYSKRLSLAGLERITGIAQGQLSHYVTGRRKPSKKTVEKIQDALHAFGNELSHVNFV